MKKPIWVVLFVCVCSLALASFGFSFAVGSAKTEEAAAPEMRAAAVLPSSLKLIGEEAFEGTGFQAVILPASLEVIEARAFANAGAVTYVYIPSATKRIGEDAFANNRHLVIEGEAGSYAEQWAQEHAFSFRRYCAPAADDERNQTGTEKQGLLSFLAAIFLLLLAELNKRKPIARRIGEGKTMRPQERAELHAIAYRFP